MKKKSEEITFTARMHPEIARKLSFIADYYGRSKNGQIVWMAKQAIVEFEHEHGKIELPEQEGDA